ncbi:hypothetical protein [Actinoplanes derwentensis]|uniref:Polysaccharide deacetylase n=1 Tax=Actinoplanes derwentensis TaxID=113562 RepID=A0A1H1ZSX8_9ACTN|nr:hypothetical protein [Actinoplanes derwentensis]GID89181.1 hypothetical protein Ade03nite_81050 [Actinoplanes derwentensis]SDT36386.1 hypothetical protein SAMN04489716_3463 [Actinoplanes derwentensis]
MTLIPHPADAIVYAPDIPRSYEPSRPPWQADAPLTVSVLLHAPAYQDVVLPPRHKPAAMQGGVGRETSEPRHGQVARLSQWDFGLTTGIFRLLDIAAGLNVPVAVALDSYGTRLPGLAAAVSSLAGEIVVRGEAANAILSPAMTPDEQQRYIREARAAVEAATGRTSTGWFSPERASTPLTSGILRGAGFAWFGDWPLDEVPVPVGDGLTALPFGLETEDMFALYTRGLPFGDYERLLDDTVDQLLADAAVTGPRFLGLSWFGWVLGQACFADVAERVLTRLAAHPDIRILLPGQVTG